MRRSATRGAIPDELARAFDDAGGIALFLDVDGTLLDIAPTPDAVRVEPATIELLLRAHAATGGALALVTGRSIADIDRLFAPLALPVAGQHGLERRDSGGEVRRHARHVPALAEVRAEIDAFAAARPGVLIEDKGLTLALHYRLAPAAGAAAAALARRIAARSADALAVESGKMVVELRPAARDKGVAVGEFMNEPPFRGRVPVFVGDDATDEHAFAVVNAGGGLSVKVGNGPTAAKFRVNGVGSVERLLARFPPSVQPARPGCT